MNTPLVSCTKCRAPLLGDVFNLPELIPCPSCGKPLQVEVFPAMFRRIAPGRDGEAVMEETESSCFYHPQKKAVLPCESCGRFLCALCDCEFNGQHLCPTCLETGRSKGKIKSLENHRTLYDSMALRLAIGSFAPPIIYFCWLTLPLSLFIAIRHWNTPTSIVRRTKIRFMLAITIALLEIIGMVMAIYFIVHNNNHRVR
ncbi:MAG: hypothetical protein JWQ04_986 [Pedosphaera sp.]|nr:hypothetical protein [Pedosphaera sp.]